MRQQQVRVLTRAMRVVFLGGELMTAGLIGVVCLHLFFGSWVQVLEISVWDEMEHAYLALEDRCEFQGERFISARIDRNPFHSFTIPISGSTHAEGLCHTPFLDVQLYTQPGRALPAADETGALTGTRWVQFQPANHFVGAAANVAQFGIRLVPVVPFGIGALGWWWWGRPRWYRLLFWAAKGVGRRAARLQQKGQGND